MQGDMSGLKDKIEHLINLDTLVKWLESEAEEIETTTEYVIYTWESLEIKLHLHDGDCYMISGRNRRS